MAESTDLRLLSEVAPGEPQEFQARLMRDISRLFSGDYPGYRRSTTRYHDLEHTLGVYLAMARLLHGASQEGVVFTPSLVNMGLASAIFHDTGLIQRTEEKEGTGARYSVGHESRSVRFALDYLERNGNPWAWTEGMIGPVILCTNLHVPFVESDFSGRETELLAKFLGTADLLAQMGDRVYLEKLLLLYGEFQEAGIQGFDSELMLLEQTEAFYEQTVKKKIQVEYEDVQRYMTRHFAVRWGVERNLYVESIKSNIAYLKTILTKYRDGYRERLRRGGVVSGL